MNIGIIGYGVVGKAIGFGFTYLGHKVSVHDITMDTSILDVIDTQVVYICVPTQSLPSGECDTSIVCEVVDDLVKIDYSGVIAIKSTVEPGTTERLASEYGQANICFVPEFLRERCAIPDFTENQDVCIIGTENDEVFNTVRESHGHYPKKVIQSTPTEAELCKYFSNLYNATLITFANSFYELCKRCGVDYSAIKTACTNLSQINGDYLDCNENLRAFGGPCLPKDLKAIAWFLKKSGSDVHFFEYLLEENAKYKTTVFEGMRE